MTDNQELADLQQELARLRDELETAQLQLVEAHKMAAVGRLTAGIVHEINTPIASILSNNEVILRSLDKVKSAVCRARDESVIV